MKDQQVGITGPQSLSKKERRQFKKEQKRLRIIKEGRRKRLVKWGFSLGIIILLAGSFFLFRYVKARRYEKAPKIQVTPTIHNFGKISASEGTAETSFEVKNIGVSPLALSGMETSCGCTTAKLKAGEKESPAFSMHGNPADWSTSLEPGETAELVVVFDPNYHQDIFGPITRTVSLFSNDPWKSKEIITVLANVIQ